MTKLLALPLFFVSSFFNGVSSIIQFHTHEGCNASFVCYHSFGASVNWTSSRGFLQQGPKLVISNTSYYSMLNLISVSPVDNGNFSCEWNETEALHFSLSVQAEQCTDIFNTATCKGTVDGGDDCTSNWMVTNCRKSCGLCPKYNCTESEQPTVPPVSSTTVSSSEFPTKARTNMTKTNYSSVTSSEFPTKARTNMTKTNSNSSNCPRSNIFFFVALLGISLVRIYLSKFL